MTPRELAAVFAAVAGRRRREHAERMSLAWHVEALSRTKKLPRLRDLTGEPEPRRRRQSADEMAAIAMRWHAVVTAA